MSFVPISSELLFKKNDPSDPRWGEKLSFDINQAQWVLRGYPDEEGIRLNGGRLGAHKGPIEIRRAFYKTTWQESSPTLYDQGDLDLTPDLKQRHEEAKQSLGDLLKKGKRAISLGGGHDYGYPDGAGFLEYCQTESSARPLIINFDAHLDVRPLDRGLSSGTPFFRLLSEYNDFDFIEIGIQPQCNAESHLRWCQEKGGHILTWPEILKNPADLCTQVKSLVSSVSGKKKSAKPLCFISLDIDCFENSAAPGCSQSWPTGITPNQFYPVLEMLKETTNIRVLGIYEVSPPLDIDNRTSKLAAQCVHQILGGLS